MKRNAKSQPTRSASKGLRLAFLLVSAAAFLLVPAAQALAAPTMSVNLIDLTGEGGGGEVISDNEFVAMPEPEPPIHCKLPEGVGSVQEAVSPGVCAGSPMFEFEGAFYQRLARPASEPPNSEFLFWEVVSGEAFEGCGLEEVNSSCLVKAEEGENAEVFAFFACQEGKECLSPGHKLTLNIEEGSGTVASNPAGEGFPCTGTAPKTCESTSFAEDSIVTLTASPAAGYAFKSWKKCDPLTPETGVNGRQCKVKMSEAKEVGVKFTKTYELTAAKAGGLGKLGTSPGGIVCLPNCTSSTAAFKEGATVTVTQAPSKHFTFTGWSGDCTGSGACTVSMSADKEVEALFTEDAKFSLSVDKEGGGQASIKSKGVGLLCGYTCYAAAADFYSGEVVAISWKLNKGTTSIEWSSGSGTCTGKSTSLEGSCTVTMSSAKSLVAKFE